MRKNNKKNSLKQLSFMLPLMAVVLVACGSRGGEESGKELKEKTVEGISSESIEENAVQSGQNANNSEVSPLEFDGIDISQIDLESDEINFGGSVVDMNVSAEELTPDELTKRADITFGGYLTKLHSWLDKDTMTMYTDYTFFVRGISKTGQHGSITLRMMGGVMDYDEYMKEIYGDEFDKTQVEKSYQYIVSAPNGFIPLSPGKDYIIYASYNETDEMYGPTGYYLGVFYQAAGEEGYTRYIGENEYESGVEIKYSNTNFVEINCP